MRDSGRSGLAACICAQVGSFERSRGLGLAGAPLSVTLPLTFVPPGAAKSVAGTQARRINVTETWARRIRRKLPELRNPDIMGRAEVEKRGRAERKQQEGEKCRANPVQI